MYYGLIPHTISRDNKFLLNGKSLVNYAIESSIGTNLYKTFISTDYPESEFKASSNADLIYIKRPDSLCEELSKATDYMLHVVNEKNLNKDDNIVLLQIECPLRTANDVNAAIALHKKSGKNTLVSGHNLPTLKQIYQNGTMLQTGECNRAERDKKEIFKRNSSVYIFNVGWFISKGGSTIFEDFPMFFNMPVYKSVEVRDKDSLILAETIIKSGINLS